MFNQIGFELMIQLKKIGHKYKRSTPNSLSRTQNTVSRHFGHIATRQKHSLTNSYNVVSPTWPLDSYASMRALMQEMLLPLSGSQSNGFFNSKSNNVFHIRGYGCL